MRLGVVRRATLGTMERSIGRRGWGSSWLARRWRPRTGVRGGKEVESLGEGLGQSKRSAIPEQLFGLNERAAEQQRARGAQSS